MSDQPSPEAEERTETDERPEAEQPTEAEQRTETEAEREEREAEEQVERDLDELGEARRERDEYLQLAQRTRADFDNYRKRVARETSEALARGKAELARELLPVIDNLERALQAGEDRSAHEALVRGVALVHDELRGRLQGAGVEAFDPTGEPFDPQLHEALSTQPAPGTDPGVILETVEKGYRLNGQVLRPARVVVSS